MTAPWCKLTVFDPEPTAARASRDVTFNTLFELVQKFVDYAGQVHGLPLDAFNLSRALLSHSDWSATRTMFYRLPSLVLGEPPKVVQSMPLIKADLVGHQARHFITATVAGMGYSGQSGALQEHLADCEGIVFKQWTEKKTAEQSDFTVGQSLFDERVQLTTMGKVCLRNMLTPGSPYAVPDGKTIQPQPSSMNDYLITADEQHGALVNCGIPNRVFAAFAQGLGGFAWKHVIKVWFKASVACARYSPEPTFAAFAGWTVEACSTLGGNQAKKARKLLRTCWADVGVEISF